MADIAQGNLNPDLFRLQPQLSGLRKNVTMFEFEFDNLRNLMH